MIERNRTRRLLFSCSVVVCCCSVLSDATKVLRDFPQKLQSVVDYTSVAAIARSMCSFTELLSVLFLNRNK